SEGHRFAQVQSVHSLLRRQLIPHPEVNRRSNHHTKAERAKPSTLCLFCVFFEILGKIVGVEVGDISGKMIKFGVELIF
ncbi:MAG: hypothetical protein SPJ37_07830, partial [Sodaliphilus sp.]|nr:hypothetical protein [Sodaliphilus sp.]